MMDLYLLRHGDALGKEEWKGDDNARALSEEGAARMGREARTLADLSLGISLILSSPLVRAMKTAQIVAAALELKGSPLPDKRLSPGFNLPALREILAEHADVAALLLVGHEPDFSETIAAVIGGGRVECKKGGLARLDIADPLRPRGSLLWLLPPRVLA
ncbi:MAG TPA: histidine phosphatase family protein, partial [Spirochaetia bacterium]|nr:histidine phosphatase family protein [Spirochaetia bacterium]